jgi:hypothetical protein
MKFLPLLFLTLCIYSTRSQQDYKIINTSINSEFAEFGVTYLKDNYVLFASSNKINRAHKVKGVKRRNNRQLYLELYKGQLTEEGNIIEAEIFTNKSTNMYFESDITFTSDFKTVYFTWNNFYDPHNLEDFDDEAPLYLFRASVDQNFQLSEITPLPFNSKNYSLRNPAVSHDDKKLYFASDMPNGFGGLDIYVVEIYEDGGFGIPQNLGPNINTEHSEMFPFSSEENVMYFSSIYQNGKFQKSSRLPSPFNGDFDDFAFVMDARRNMGFFSSTRKESLGDADIFSFSPNIIE